jgi:DNA-binding transcriptional ArsR family regulator
MNTKKAPCLNRDQVAAATLMLRAYKHRFRYDIIAKLLANGRMSSGEIASYLDLEEPYISEQLDILRDSDLVQAEFAEDGVFFHANEPKLQRIRDVVTSFIQSDRF